jgi:hypothetical protein
MPSSLGDEFENLPRELPSRNEFSSFADSWLVYGLPLLVVFAMATPLRLAFYTRNAW